MKNRLMFSSRIFNDDLKSALTYALNNKYYGIEWYLNSLRLPLNLEKMKIIIDKFREHNSLYFSFHLPTRDVEIGHNKQKYANTSLEYMKMYIDLLTPWFKEQDYRTPVTMHIGANGIPMEKLNWEKCRKNIEELARYIYEADGLLVIENLKSGWAADPDLLMKLVANTKAGITLDVGHAKSSPLIRSKEISIIDYINKLNNINHLHFYGYETLTSGEHKPPESWANVEDIWKKIDSLNSRGIVLELTSKEELEYTKALIEDNIN